VWYSYAIVRVVPRVERGEFLNVGAVLFAREAAYLAARLALDPARLQALAPGVDLAPIERHLCVFAAIAAGEPVGGPLAALPPAERFHWLTAPRSTVIQTSPIHEGTTADPAATLESLLVAFVLAPPGLSARRGRDEDAAPAAPGPLPQPPPLQGRGRKRGRDLDCSPPLEGPELGSRGLAPGIR
jgi:hypothetical protein